MGKDTLLPEVIDGWYESLGDIKERPVGERPLVAMVIFPKEQYTGQYKCGFFAEDQTTYFTDSEQFFDSQRAVAEQLGCDFLGKGRLG